MTALRPFFTYFGGKWRASQRYPAPLHRKLTEPCAGSAGYATRHAHLDVLLIEKSEPIAAVWDYLIRVPSAELLGLPLLEYGQNVDSVPGLTQEQRWLIGLWCNQGSAQPKKTLMRWTAANGEPRRSALWCREIRERLARQVEHIRHWRILWGDYSTAPDEEATWFIDPPYQLQGRHYPCGADDLDFEALGIWCRSRRGQVLVCEALGADWLPFQSFGQFKSNERGDHRKARSPEALWMNDWPGAALWLPASNSVP